MEIQQNVVTTSSDDAGKLVLRLVLGILVLLHGIAKVMSGPGFIVGVVEKAGLPAPVAYLVYIGEVLAPVLLILGVWTRIAAAIIAINMLFAFFLVHMSDVFSLSKTGGWALELQGMYLGAAICLILLGAGRYSLAGSMGRYN